MTRVLWGGSWFPRGAVTFLLLLAPGLSFAHPPSSRVRGVTQADSAEEGEVHRVYGGYGYIAESEAEAYEALNFGCERADLETYQRVACPAAAAPTVGAPSVVNDVMRAVVLQDLQRHEAEFSLMQAGALGDRSVSPPSCLMPDARLGALPAALPSAIPPTSELLAMPPAERELNNRYRVAASPLMSDEMIRGLLFADQMHEQLIRYCPPARQVQLCQDLRNQEDRVKTSFPALFGPGTDSARQELRESVQQLLGSRFSYATRPAVQVRRGEHVYRNALGVWSGDAVGGLESRISRALRDTTAPSSSVSEAERARLSAARDRLNGALRRVHAEQLARTRSSLEAVCRRPSVDDYLRTRPNIVRQMLNDASPERRAMARLVLCESPALPRVQVRTSCQGVHAVRGAAPRTLETRRTDYSFPFASSLNYRVSEPSRPPVDAPYVVETTLHIRADRGMTADATRAQVSRMENQANAFYNCMTGQRATLQGVDGLPDRNACPPNESLRNPPVQFRIHVALTPPAPATEPLVALHECYNAELPAPQNSNCERVRAHSIAQCQDNIRLWQRQGRVGASARFAPDMREFLENIAIAPPHRPAAPNANEASPTPAGPDVLHMSPQEMERHCEETNPSDSTGRYDREDSGNYTVHTSAGTTLHEIGHAMGLPDEYADPAYPFLPQGEHNSLMNNSDSPEITLANRHLLRIIEPAQCGTERRRAGAPR